MSGAHGAFVMSLLGTIYDLTNERAALAAELERSELRVKKLTFLAYGKKTERLSREKLIQLVPSFGGSAQQAQAKEPEVPHGAAPDEPIEQDALAVNQPAQGEEQAAPKRKRPHHPGRTRLAPELERVIDPIRVPAEQRRCACCQHEMQVIGHVDHERVEYIPAKVVVHVERGEKLACRRSECRGDITTAPRADDAGPRRRAGASLLAQLIEAKCDDGLPMAT